MKKFISSLIISSFLIAPVLADSQNDLSISVNQVPLNSSLKKQYAGYKYIIQNTSGKDINIVNAQIDNGTNGSVAYNAVDNSHPIAVTWAICGPVGLFTLGIGWAVGIVATPIVWFVSSSDKSKARTESNAYPSMVSLGYIKKGQSIEANTLVPVGAKPQLKLTVQESGEKDLILINK